MTDNIIQNEPKIATENPTQIVITESSTVLIHFRLLLKINKWLERNVQQDIISMFETVLKSVYFYRLQKCLLGYNNIWSCK